MTRNVGRATMPARLALDGWVVLAIRYPFTPHVTVEQQVETVRSAVRWACTPRVVRPGHAGDVGGARRRLGRRIIWRRSRRSPRATTTSGSMRAWVLYAIYDMANRNRTRAHWAKVPNVVMRESTVEQAPARYRDLSPIDRIHDATPPMLVIHGTRDTLVPVREGEQFVEAMRDAGRPVDYVPVRGAEHAFDAFAAVTGRTVAAVARDWLGRATRSADTFGGGDGGGA